VPCVGHWKIISWPVSDIQRMHRQTAFDRLLCRLFHGSWEEPFGEMAAECGLDKDLAEEYHRLASFLAGILN
jgi:hypothetical protein